RAAVAGLTTTAATGTSVTVTVALPAFPSLVAVTVADPAAPAVTRPLVLTDATSMSLLAQVTGRPVSAPPAESSGTAASCSVAPTGRLAVAGVTDTEATGRGPTAPPPFGSVASLARQPMEIPAPAAMAIARIEEAGKYFAPGQHRTRTPGIGSRCHIRSTLLRLGQLEVPRVAPATISA